jgi:hypothetical protein
MSEKQRIHVVVPPTVGTRQIDGFPSDCERSVQGALHVRPGSMQLTEGELEHIRKHHKDVARRLTLKPARPAKAAEPAKTPTTLPAPPDEAEGDTEAPEAAQPTPAPSPKSGGGSGGQRGGTSRKS